MICKSYAAAFDSSPQRQRLRRYQHHHNAFDVICSLSTTCVEAVGGVRPNALSTLKETKGLSQVAHRVWLIYVANVFMLLTSSVLSLIWWCYRQGRLCCSSAGTCICLCTHSFADCFSFSCRFIWISALFQSSLLLVELAALSPEWRRVHQEVWKIITAVSEVGSWR